MAKSISKLNIRILTAILLVISLILCLFAYNQGSIAKTQALTTNYLASTQSPSNSIISANDTNWSGYVVASDLQNPQATVTGVSASWIVPTVTISSQDTFSAVWIGIGGYFDKLLIQTGTEQDSIQGQSEYYAWLEMLPQNSLTIDNIIVSPGDQMSASIQLVDATLDEWSIDIRDLTTNQEYTGNVFYASSQLSAEWIVERPEITSRRSNSSLTSLADIGTIEFSNCKATIGDQTGTISSFPTIQSLMYQSVQTGTDSGKTQLATVSDLVDNGSIFTVETSPQAIPELSIQLILPFAIGMSLLAIAIRKRQSALKTTSY